MANKYFDGVLTRDMDWGGDEHTGGLPASGRAVQEFIKSEYGAKFGVARISQLDTATNFYSIELFKNKDDEKAYDELDDKDSDVAKALVTRITIPISAVQGDSYTAKLTADIPQKNIVIVDGKLVVPFRFSAIKYTQGEASNEGARGSLHIQISSDNGSTWKDVTTISNRLISRDNTDESFYEDDKVDLGGYLSDGKKNLRVRASYGYEDIATGESRVAYSSWVSIGASVTKTKLELELVTPYNNPMYATNDETGAYNNFAVEYRAYGAVDKTLYVKVEGSLGVQTTSLPISSLSNGDTKGISISYSETYGIHTHGVRKVTAWMEANDGLGNIIKSNELNNQFMMIADKSNTKKYLLLQNVARSVTNYIQTRVAEFSVYAPDGSETELSFNVQDTKGNSYAEITKKVASKTTEEVLATIEIEPVDEGSVPEGYNTRFYVFNGSENFIESSGLNKYGYYDLYVDNKDAVTPVLGATFLMNPKSRDNSESTRDRIYNAKADNAEVKSDFVNFGFINDGWMTDEDNQKVLRVMAGSTLTIHRNIWKQFLDGNYNSGLTIEIDYKVSNVTNTEDPIVQIKGGSGNKGIILNALKGWVRTSSYTNDDNCMFAWREGQRQFLSINLHNNVQPLGDGCIYPASMESQAKQTIALARVLLNGDPVREIPFDRNKQGEWCDDANAAIVIGNEGADIDIYSIRVYENKAIDWADLQQKNYPSSLPTTDAKRNFLERNAIRLGRYISLEETLKKGLNCIVYHARRPYIHEKTEPNCWIEYHRFDQNGKALPEYSGTNCQQSVEYFKNHGNPEKIETLSIKSQGSTAETYYDFNIQDNNSDVEATIQVAVKDFHESISVRIDGDKAYIKGGNLGKNFPYEETEVAYPYSNGYVTVPDGWIDGNSKYRGMGYMVAEGTALAQKKVAKINYASAMQSHLLGACKSYDELHFLCVGATPLQQAYSNRGLTRPVLAKHTEPFMMFWEENGVVTFSGLCIYGAAKMDKVAFGYVKELMPMYSMIEGSDNNLPLTDFRVPFDDEVKTTLKDGEMDGWTYNGETSFDYDAGATSDDDTDASPAIRKMWGKYHNFIYLNSTNIKVFDGSVDEFLLSNQATTDIVSKYWCTTGSKAFHLLRYDHRLREGTDKAIGWVDAGLKGTGGKYSVVDLKTDPRTKTIYEQYKNSTAYSEINNAFKQCFADFFKAHGKFLLSMESLLFNYSYVLSFLAGTDNSSKNTYFVIDPIVQDMSGESNDAFSSWYLTTFGESFDYTKCYLVYMAGDDMDSILPVNNMGNLTKPYYIERLYPYADGKTECLYEGINNSLFNLVEAAFTFDERSAMMNSILSKMQSLVSNDDNLLALKDNKQSVWGFLHKYFFNTQYYFPQIAYLEQARIRYEFAEVMGHKGARGVSPISQSIGSNVENEMQFMEQRVVYMASFAEFGSLGNNSGSIGLTDTTDQLAFRGSEMPDGTPATFTFTVTPHQYIYPCGFFGQTTVPSKQRTSPKQTCTITIARNVVGTPDAQMGIRGANYYSDYGDFSNKSISTDLKIKGKRLTKIKAYGEWYSGNEFRATNIEIATSSLKELLIAGVLDVKNIDLSSCIRCRTINIVYSYFRSVQLPETSNLSEIKMGNPVFENFIIKNIPNLSVLVVEYVGSIKNVHIGQNVGTKTGFFMQPVVESIYTAQKSQSNRKLQSIHIENVNWTNFPVEALEWYCDVPTCEFKGTIAIKEDDHYGNPRVTWDLKNKINKKFGCVDGTRTSYYNGLLLSYKKKEVDISALKMKGNFYVGAGDTFKFELVPNSIYENNYFLIRFSEDMRYASMSTYDGVMTIQLRYLSNTKELYTISAEIIWIGGDGAPKSYTVSKTIEIWNRPAQVGDLVYADGTFSSAEAWEDEKTPIGICIFNGEGDTEGINTNPKDTQKRLMMALENVSIPLSTGSTSSMAWGAQIKDGSTLTDWNKQYALFDLAQDGSLVNLTSPAVTNVYDIPTIVNLSTRGLDNQYIDPDPATNENGTASDYRNTEDPNATAYNDGFKLVNAGYAVGDGFAYNETETEVKARTLDDSLAKLAGSAYAKDNIVNSGYAKTLKIIQHRNSILNNNLIGADGEVLLSGGTLQLPSGDNEMNALGALMDNLRIWAANNLEDAYPDKWMQLAYPFASACYAYQPTMKLKDGEVLADKFKAHNFFAPTEGILTRICWLVKYGQKTPYDPFKTAREKNLLKNISSSSYHWDVTESGSGIAWGVSFGGGGTGNSSKHGRNVGGAVSAF